MTKENEKKLLETLALSHLGDSKFAKKYGLNITVQDYEEVNEQNLDELNRSYQEQFILQIDKLLDEQEMTDEFFKDLVYRGCSLPL